MRCKVRHLTALGNTCSSISDTTVTELAARGAPIVVLCVPSPRLTTVAAVALALRKVDASLDSGVNDAGLVCAACIVDLNAARNVNISTVAPFARSAKTGRQL